MVSGILTTCIDVFSFVFAGLVFAALLTPSIWIWKRRIGSSAHSLLVRLASFLLIALAAPLFCFLLVSLVDWLAYRPTKVVITPLVTPGPSLSFILGVALAWCGWVFSLAASIKIITGKWDRRFVFQLLFSGVGVLALAFGYAHVANYKDQIFVHTLYLAGQTVSGFLFGASLERLSPSTVVVDPSPATLL